MAVVQNVGKTDYELLRNVEGYFDSTMTSIDELDEKIKILVDHSAKQGELLREISRQRDDINRLFLALSRMQNRFDTQLLALVLANIASGVGVAAIVLGASRAL